MKNTNYSNYYNNYYKQLQNNKEKKKQPHTLEIFLIILLIILLLSLSKCYFYNIEEEEGLVKVVDIEIAYQGSASEGSGLRPGSTIERVPLIVNKATGTPAYVFAEIIVPCYDKNGDGTVDSPLFSFNNSAGWTLINSPTIDVSARSIKYLFAYGTADQMTLLGPHSTTETPVYSSMVLEPSLTKAQIEKISGSTSIEVNGYGIETEKLGVTKPLDIFDLLLKSNAKLNKSK